MRPRDKPLYKELNSQLLQFSKDKYALPGINTTVNRGVFIKQLIDSIRRVKYVITMCHLDICEERADPTSNIFDPLKAAVFFKRKGKIDEAFWLTFLAIHFGKALKSGWRLARDIYGSLGGKDHWTWERTSSDPEEFKSWLSNNYTVLKGGDGIPRNFGNHRKYETLKPDSRRGTGNVIESYIRWVGPHRSHMERIQQAENEVGNNPRTMFDNLYNSMDIVIAFGRTGRFDYLTMLAKLGLAKIEPGSTFMEGSTGPAKGARLLFSGDASAKLSCAILEEKLCMLEEDLSLGEIGMQVLEDALCNWQKSPKTYKHFQG